MIDPIIAAAKKNAIILWPYTDAEQGVLTAGPERSENGEDLFGYTLWLRDKKSHKLRFVKARSGLTFDELFSLNCAEHNIGHGLDDALTYNETEIIARVCSGETDSAETLEKVIDEGLRNTSARKMSELVVDYPIPDHIETKKLVDDLEWVEWARSKWWFCWNKTVPKGHGPNIFVVRDRMLAIGGHNVIIGGYACDLGHDDPDDSTLYFRGQFFPGDIAVLIKGRPCQCHDNSAKYCREHPDAHMCTGYALSEDGLWRQHSWCIKPHGNSYRIIETTELRVAYYGFILTPEELAERI